MAADGLKEPLKNYSLVGGCYDILYVDPVDLSSKAAKFPTAFRLDQLENIPGQNASKPVALDFVPQFGGGSDRLVTELSSSSDFQTYLKREGSLSVSDPTGALFGATLSGSFESLRQETGNRSSVLTYVSERVTRYKLAVSSDDSVLALTQALQDAFERLPETDGPAYARFNKTFGTHYLREAVYGGRATQRLSVSSEDYVTFLQQGVDLSAQASLTLDIVKTQASASSQDKRDSKFTRASSLTVGKVVYVGGYTQEYLDMWAMSVPDQPMPIEGGFAPLYELLTPMLMPDADPDGLARKRALLQAATESYIAANGADVRPSRLRFGDVVTLELQGSGPSRLIAAGSGGYARTTRAQDGRGDKPPAESLWRLTDPAGGGGSDAPGPGSDVVLTAVTDGSALDAQAGTDGSNYFPGDGLTGAVAEDAATTSAHWGIELAGGSDRPSLVDGDIVRLRSRWRGRRHVDGFLLGETDPDDPGQRVYAFGGMNQPGAIWKIRRADGE